MPDITPRQTRTALACALDATLKIKDRASTASILCAFVRVHQLDPSSQNGGGWLFGNWPCREMMARLKASSDPAHIALGDELDHLGNGKHSSTEDANAIEALYDLRTRIAHDSGRVRTLGMTVLLLAHMHLKLRRADFDLFDPVTFRELHLGTGVWYGRFAKDARFGEDLYARAAAD